MSAFIVANLLSMVVYDHAVSLMPAAARSIPNPPAALQKFPLWFLGGAWAAYAWLRPVHLTLNRGRTELLRLARSRVRRLYPFFAIVGTAIWLPTLIHVVRHSQTDPAFPLPAGVAAILLSAYYSAYAMILYFEALLPKAVLPRLYADEEGQAAKPGATLSVHLKLWLMILNLVVIPMGLILATILTHHDSFLSIWPTPAEIVIVALACVVGYCEVLYGGVTKPLRELARKMRQVADGDFSVRAFVAANDEIGTIQTHFNEMVQGLEERERLRDTFGRYVSVEIARKLIDDRRVDLGGESIEATILFSDIRNFTPMSERMQPDALVNFLNSYFSHVTVPVMEHRGVINKFIGDAVMAVFAPQFGSENHADDAIAAATGMREALARFNAERDGETPVEFGVGIHTGTLVAGNIGTETRLEYTLIGDTVNVASRIESSNKALGSTILVSAATRERMSPEKRGAIEFERLDDVRLKGKSEATTLYKVV
jgi:class 3 adenylate cyclase